MRSLPILIMFLTSLTASNLSVASPPEDTRMSSTAVNPKDRADIEALLEQEMTAWNRGDATAFGARTLPDIVFTNVVGRFSVGREPFLAQHAHIFSTMYKGSRLAQEIQHLVLVRPDVAIVDTLTAVSGYQSLPPGATALNGTLHSRLEQVLVKNEGAWWIAAFHNVAVNTSIPGLLPNKP